MRTDTSHAGPIHTAWCGCRHCAAPRPGAVTQRRHRRIAITLIAAVCAAILLFA